MTDIYRVDISDINGRYVSCEDSPAHLSGWLFRTIERLAADQQWQYYRHEIRFVKVTS
jgi:hypothetical protein